MSTIYEKLAVYRNNFRSNSKEEATEILSIIEQIYDVANKNKRNPGHLPFFFYVYHVHLNLDEFKKIIHDIGIDTLEINTMKYDKQKGSNYQIVRHL